MRLLTFLSLLGISLFTSNARAEVDNEVQVWTAVLGTAKLGDAQDTGPRLWLDMHGRRTSGGVVHLFRPGFGWSVSPHLSLWTGYAWTPTFPDDGDTVHEHRGWQQVVAKTQTSSGISLQSRTRFEERFRDADDIGLRVREFVRLSRPLNDEKTVGVVGWDELFVAVNDTDWGQEAGFDQNRLFAGAYTTIREHLRLEMGYLFVYLNRETDQAAHVLATNLFWTL